MNLSNCYTESSRDAALESWHPCWVGFFMIFCHPCSCRRPLIHTLSNHIGSPSWALVQSLLCSNMDFLSKVDVYVVPAQESLSHTTGCPEQKHDRTKMSWGGVIAWSWLWVGGLQLRLNSLRMEHSQGIPMHPSFPTREMFPLGWGTQGEAAGSV